MENKFSTFRKTIKYVTEIRSLIKYGIFAKN